MLFQLQLRLSLSSSKMQTFNALFDLFVTDFLVSYWCCVNKIRRNLSTTQHILYLSRESNHIPPTIQHGACIIQSSTNRQLTYYFLPSKHTRTFTQNLFGTWRSTTSNNMISVIMPPASGRVQLVLASRTRPWLYVSLYLSICLSFCLSLALGRDNCRIVTQYFPIHSTFCCDP